MQLYKRSMALSVFILVLFVGITVTAVSAESTFYSQYGGSVSIVDVDHNVSVQEVSSLQDKFVVIHTLSPEIVEVDVGDTVTWNNLQRPKKPIVLVSDDGLWEPQTIYYGKSFAYTFQDTGTYTFVIEGTQMKGSVIVSEKILESPAEGSDTAPGSMPMMVWNETKNTTQSIMQTMTGTVAQLTRETNEFLMITTMQPTSMEVQAGENVTWHNLQRPKKSILVVSKENLWEPQTIYYGKTFTYTFKTAGNYTFMLEGTNITGNVLVTELSMASVPGSVEEAVTPSVPVPGPVMVLNETMEQSMEKARETLQAATQAKEFLMIITLEPTSMEIEAGESVTWRNLQRPKKPIMVVSQENLWEPQTIYYGKTFSYRFDDPGTYTFVLEGTGISGTIVVT